MKVVFVGESPGRAIAVEGGVIVAEKGVPVEVPDELGQSLLAQDVFETAPAAKAKKEEAQ